VPDGIEVEYAICPQCGSVNIDGFHHVEIESAHKHRGGWKMTGKIVQCSNPGCFQTLKLVSKTIEIELSDAWLCEYCGTREHMRLLLESLEKKLTGSGCFRPACTALDEIAGSGEL
jgi:hypothetical protein